LGTIIPFDELHHFSEGFKPPTRKKIWQHLAASSSRHVCPTPGVEGHSHSQDRKASDDLDAGRIHRFSLWMGIGDVGHGIQVSWI